MAAMAIDAEVHPDGAVYEVYVDHQHADEARRLLREEYPDGFPGVGVLSKATGISSVLPVPPEAWFGRGAVAVLAVMAVCVAMHIYVHAGSDIVVRARMIEMGAISYALVESGEYWRLLAAVMLHFDFGHLLSNMAVMLVVAPPLAHQAGPMRFLAIFFAAGVSGNIASHALFPTAGLKAGASGAIAGVIGGLGAYGLRYAEHSRFKHWQVFAALLAFYAMVVGFGPGRDNTAHLFGLLSGLLYGRILNERS